MMKLGSRVFLIWTPIFFIGLIVYAVCIGRITVQDNLDVSQKWFPSYSQGLLKQNEKALRQNSDVNKIKINAIQGLSLIHI